MMKAEIRKYQRRLETDQEKTDARDREDLILKYAPLVKSIAERMAIRLPPHISAEELTSAGIVGLLDALDKFQDVAFNKQDIRANAERFARPAFRAQMAAYIQDKWSEFKEQQ